MTFKFNALVAALALVASAGANAAIQSSTNPGNSSVIFVASSLDGTKSLTVDLGVNMADFLKLAPTGYTFGAAAGALSADTTTASWNFSNNEYVLNNAAAVTTGNSWTDAWTSFSAAAGTTYKWGVIAADNISTAGVSGTNTLSRYNLLSTGAPTQTNVTAVNSSVISTGSANPFTAFVNASNAVGTHTTAANGANYATGGNELVNTIVKDKFGTNLPWSYLLNVTAGTESTSAVFLSHANNAAATVFQLGSTYSVDTLLADATQAASFTFDGTTLSYQVTAVPEASTIAMMLAGLGAVGFVARRRKSA